MVVLGVGVLLCWLVLYSLVGIVCILGLVVRAGIGYLLVGVGVVVGTCCPCGMRLCCRQCWSL